MDIIVAYMMDYNPYADCQHGFCKHRSCATQLLYGADDMFDNGDPFDSFHFY